jgi:hypothetical protein
MFEDLWKVAQRPIETECLATECVDPGPSLRRVDIGYSLRNSAPISPRWFGLRKLRAGYSVVRVCHAA